MERAQLHPDHVYEARARVARAMAHPTRLLLLDALSGAEHSVAVLTRLAGVDQSTVSRHLAILRDAGLVVARKDRQQRLYRVCCGCLDGFFGCLESVLREENERRRQAVAS